MGQQAFRSPDNKHIGVAANKTKTSQFAEIKKASDLILAEQKGALHKHHVRDLHLNLHALVTTQNALAATLVFARETRSTNIEIAILKEI